MFEHIGQDLDPQWRRRYVLATAITAAGGGGAVGVTAALSVLAMSVIHALGLQPTPPEPFELTAEAVEMIQVVLLEEEEVLLPPEAPDALPEPPPAPPTDELAKADGVPATSAGEPEQAIAEAPGEAPEVQMDEAVQELEDREDDALADLDDPATGEPEEPPSEEALLATKTRLDALEQMRAEGLLTMGELGFDRKDLDPGYTDESRRFDGIFGPRDSHILMAALRNGQVDALRTANAESAGSYSMSFGSFGFTGFAGARQAMRLPAPRELLEAAKPSYPRKLRKLFGDAVDCSLHITVDGAGHPIGFKVTNRPLPCPEELHEHALQAAHDSVWAASADSSEATVAHVVEFRK